MNDVKVAGQLATLKLYFATIEREIKKYLNLPKKDKVELWVDYNCVL